MIRKLIFNNLKRHNILEEISYMVLLFSIINGMIILIDAPKEKIQLNMKLMIL